MCLDNKKLSILGQTWQQIHGCIPEPKKSNIKKIKKKISCLHNNIIKSFDKVSNAIRHTVSHDEEEIFFLIPESF